MEKYFPPVISQKIFIDTQYTLNYDAWLSCCSSAPPPTWCSYHDLQHAGVGLVDDLRLHERWSDREVVRMDLLQPHGALQWRVQGNAWRFLVTILANILILQPRPQWNSILQISDARDINSEPFAEKVTSTISQKIFTETFIFRNTTTLILFSEQWSEENGRNI